MCVLIVICGRAKRAGNLLTVQRRCGGDAGAISPRSTYDVIPVRVLYDMVPRLLDLIIMLASVNNHGDQLNHCPDSGPLPTLWSALECLAPTCDAP